MLRSKFQANEDKSMFQLLFLKDDENQSVKVEEVEEIDFKKVRDHLEQGESVFITPKRREKAETRLIEG